MNKIKHALNLILPFTVYIIAGIILLNSSEHLSDELNIRSGIAYDLLKGEERGREGLICSVWWAPLPTLLQLVFGLFPSLIKSGIAGVIISSAGGAMFFFFLYKSLVYLGIKSIYSYLICIFAGLNPWILFFSTTGASEAILLGIFTGALWGFLTWHFEQRLSGLITMSLLASLLPLIKHQTIFLAIGILLAGVTTAVWGKNNKLHRAEGTIFLAVFPIFYTTGLWFLFNWLVMGDFLYFIKGIYLNPVQARMFVPEWATEIARMYEPWVIQFYIMPLIPIAVIVMFVSFFQKQGLLTLKYLLMLAILPVYHILMNSRHQSFNLTGDMAIAIPVSILILGMFVKGLLKSSNSAVKPISFLVTILVLLGTIFSYGFIATGGLKMPLSNSPEFPFVTMLKGTQEELKIKEFIMNKEEDSKIAIVGFSGYSFIKNSNGGDEFVHTINLDMRKTLRNTRGKTLYFIVPKPLGTAAFDSINLNLPGLYYTGETSFSGSDIKAHFMLESKDFDNWRIFTIVRPGQNETIFGTPKEISKNSQ